MTEFPDSRKDWNEDKHQGRKERRGVLEGQGTHTQRNDGGNGQRLVVWVPEWDGDDESGLLVDLIPEEEGAERAVERGREENARVRITPHRPQNRLTTTETKKGNGRKQKEEEKRRESRKAKYKDKNGKSRKAEKEQGAEQAIQHGREEDARVRVTPRRP